MHKQKNIDVSIFVYKQRAYRIHQIGGPFQKVNKAGGSSILLHRTTTNAFMSM